MAMVVGESGELTEGMVWGLCRMPFWLSGGGGGGGGRASSNSSTQSLTHHLSNSFVEGSNTQQRRRRQQQRPSSGVPSVAKSLLPARRQLRLDPGNKLYFPMNLVSWLEVQSRLKTSKSHVAFKFQTTAPKSCFMRPPGGILAPGESIIATVFKFVEHPENNEKQPEQKCKVKFKIVSLKVKGPMEYIPELFDEQKDQISVEQILQVFLDVEHPSPQMEKLKHQLAEADAALEARKKPPEDTSTRIVGEGLVIDEWKERREKYLVRQQIEVVDSA